MIKSKCSFRQAALCLWLKQLELFSSHLEVAFSIGRWIPVYNQKPLSDSIKFALVLIGMSAIHNKEWMLSVTLKCGLSEES